MKDIEKINLNKLGIQYTKDWLCKLGYNCEDYKGYKFIDGKHAPHLEIKNGKKSKVIIVVTRKSGTTGFTKFNLSEWHENFTGEDKLFIMHTFNSDASKVLDTYIIPADVVSAAIKFNNLEFQYRPRKDNKKVKKCLMRTLEFYQIESYKSEDAINLLNK